MKRRVQDILFFVLLTICVILIGYGVYTTFIATDEFYDDCSNCYKDGHDRHWDMDKDK